MGSITDPASQQLILSERLLALEALGLSLTLAPFWYVRQVPMLALVQLIDRDV
jgi:hypothetical protein